MTRFETIPSFGFPNFLTRRRNINGNFRPCATTFQDSDILNRKVQNEWQEIHDANNSEKKIITWHSQYTSPYIFRPYRLVPDFWNTKTKSDCQWYFSKDERYIDFRNWEDTQFLIPAAISVVLPIGEGLSWVTYSGYAHDANLKRAKQKALFELIERDDFAAWWHKNLRISPVDVGNSPLCTEMITSIHQNKYVITCNVYSIPNEWYLSTMMTVIELSEYPYIVFGLGTSESEESATTHSILEAVNSIKGLSWSAMHGDIDYPNQAEKISLKLAQTVNGPQIGLKPVRMSINFYQLQKNTQTYFSKISEKNGFTVKAFSTLLQPEVLTDTTPFSNRLIFRTEHPLIREISPFT